MKTVGFFEVPSTFWEDQPDLAALIEVATGEGACKYCTPVGGVHEDGCPFKVGA